MLTVANVANDSFGIDASLDGKQLNLTLTGTGDMAAVEPLKECLTQVRGDVDLNRLATVTVNIRSLYLLNSSCIKAFVRFIYLIQTEGPPVSVQFLVDPNLGWQKRALAALERMAPDIVTVK